MDDGMTIEMVDGGHEAVLEFLLGSDADMAEHRAGELGEEAFDQIEPRAVFLPYLATQRKSASTDWF